jgi:hypothetical protein
MFWQIGETIYGRALLLHSIPLIESWIEKAK